MTPSDAAILLRLMLHPLIQDPSLTAVQTGVRLKIEPNRIVINATERNMGRIIGLDGVMIKSLRILFQSLGVQVDVADYSDDSASSPIPDGPVSVPALAKIYLQEWLGNDWSQSGDEARSLFIIPQGQYSIARDTAFNTWAYRSGKAICQRIKYKLEAA